MVSGQAALRVQSAGADGIGSAVARWEVDVSPTAACGGAALPGGTPQDLGVRPADGPWRRIADGSHDVPCPELEQRRTAVRCCDRRERRRGFPAGDAIEDRESTLVG